MKCIKNHFAYAFVRMMLDAIRTVNSMIKEQTNLLALFGKDIKKTLFYERLNAGIALEKARYNFYKCLYELMRRKK